MGLRISHDAFEGLYSTFNHFRRFVLTSIRGYYPPHKQEDLDNLKWYWNQNMPFSNETHPGLKEFLSHSDSEGEIQPEMCKVIADELECILPYIESFEKQEEGKMAMTAQILRQGGYVQVTKNFIKGCRTAYLNNEVLEFM